MTIVAYTGVQLPVASRVDQQPDEIVTAGEYYETVHDLTGGNLSRTQALEFIRNIRRRSYDYADVVKLEYAGLDESSPQRLTMQVQIIKSTRSPFVVTLALIMTGIVFAAKAALIIGGVALVLHGAYRFTTAILAPFATTTTTTYIDPETGDEYGTYEEYTYAWGQRNPGVPPPDPGTKTETSASWATSIVALVIVGILIVLVFFFWQRYGGKGGKKK